MGSTSWNEIMLPALPAALRMMVTVELPLFSLELNPNH